VTGASSGTGLGLAQLPDAARALWAGTRRDGSWILNVASLAAYQPAGLREAAYHASPAFVWSFTKGVARELRGSGNVGATPRQFIKMPFLTMS